MSAFGKLLGTTFAVVLVSKVGLAVAFHADKQNVEQAQEVVNRINNNTSQLAAPFSRLVAEQKVDTAGIVLNYTLKPGFVENVQAMADAELRRSTLSGYSLDQFVNEGINVVVKFRNQDGQLIKDVTFSQQDMG